MVEAVVGLDGVSQTAGFADDRDSAVSHGDELCQTAGLKAGGNENRVGSGVELVGSLVGIHDVGAYPALVIPLVASESVLILLVAGSDDNDLGVIVDDAIHHGVNKVKTLLVGQTGDNADHELVDVSFQTKLALELFLVPALSVGEVVHTVSVVDVPVGAGVVYVVIHAVDDAAELVGIIVEHAFKSLAVFGSSDFIGVGVADGGDEIRVDDAALHDVGVGVELKAVRGERVLRNIGMILDGINVGNALEMEVVDGEDGLCAVVEWVALIDGVQIDRNQSRLPVVAVNDVGMEADSAHGGKHSLREEDEGHDVACHIGVGIAPAEEVLVVDEIESYAVPPVLHETHVIHMAVTGEVHVEMCHIGHIVAEMLGNAGVSGQNNAHVQIALIGKSPRKRRHNVSQTAGLDKRIALRTNKQNIAHISSS